MEAHFDREAARKSTKLNVNGDLLEKALKLGVDIDSTLEEALAREVHNRQRETWLAENREAIEAYNQHVAKLGVFSAGLRGF
jgi:antitoxin CcdA